MIPALVPPTSSARFPPAGDARSVRITQEGRMWKTPGAAPRHFTAVQQLAVDRLAFAWHARFPIITPFAISVTDSYADGR